MSEEIKVDAPAAEEVKTDTVQEETKPATEETKPVVATEATPAQKEAIAALSDEDREALAARASKQINFYFSDSNLPIDRYFFTLTTFNKEGWVPIETILTFKRMREFEPYGVPFVVEALKRVISEEGNDPLLALDEQAGNVRRIRPMEAQSDAWSRSVYVKGFGAGETEDNTQEKLERFFEQFGAINAVRKRREDIPDQGFKGKGKGDFKGSVFVEFAYEKDLNAFLESEEPKKYTPESTEEITKMTKDAYVKMKAKEKGIPDSEVQKGGNKAPGGKWNAFREMGKVKAGGTPMLAKIPDGVKIVGAPGGIHQNRERDNGKKRSRDDDGEEGSSKREKVDEPKTFTLNYKGKDVECDKTTGQVVDRAELAFPEEAVVEFQGGTDSPDWKDLKEKIMSQITKPFMAFPPGATVGNLAKQDDAQITDEDLAKLNDAKFQFGGADCVFSRMTEDEQRSFWLTRANYQGKLAAAKFASEAKPERKPFDKGGRGGGRGGGGRGGGGRGRGGRGRGGGGGRGRGGRGGGRDGGHRGERNQEKAEGMPPSVGAA